MQDKVTLVKQAMLAVQRYPWEQGVCAQAVWELGDVATAVAMAHDAVLRQKEDGRLAVINDNIAVTDPAANGEAVWRAYEVTGNDFYKNAAERMLDYLMQRAPRTDQGILCHNEISFYEEFSADQIWADSVYMAPPFLAVMGELDEAVRQIEGYLDYLQDEVTGLLYHIYDTGTKQFVRKKLWATGNGWALLGIARVIETAKEQGRDEVAEHLADIGTKLLDSLLKYQLSDGRFRDILDDKTSFPEGTAAMMMAATVYRGVYAGWLSEDYIFHADLVYGTMPKYLDEYGIIHEVCGCPDFFSSGTSAESMASFLMMEAWHKKLGERE